MSVAPEMAFASIVTLGKELRAGTFTSVELTEFFLHRLETIGKEYNAVVTVTADLAREQAKLADRELAEGTDRGPLHGIPYGAKDLLNTVGYPTTWGADSHREQQIDNDALTVIKLRQAGAVLTAKLAMVAFAGGFGYSGPDSSFTGPCLNPWSKGHWAGGSSTGPGTAVGAGLCPFAIGTETSGSIISPAASCGVAGLRPTFGRVSRTGAMTLSWTLDKIGPLCHTAEDCGLVLNAIAGFDADDPSTISEDYHYPPAKTLEPPFRLAKIAGAVDHVLPEVKENFLASLDILKSVAVGGDIPEVSLPEFPYDAVVNTILHAESSAALQEVVLEQSIWELPDPRMHLGAYSTMFVSARDYINALRIRAKFQRALDDLFAEYDALITPTFAMTSYPSDRPFRDYTAGKGLVHLNLRQPTNGAGLPAISIPNGFGEHNLPTGLQFIGSRYEENRLLTIAEYYQSQTEWHLRTPELA
ncbi:MAG: amidase [Planctomycetota bacterium]|nr:amidase [Planctomycetota bacterium]MDA1214468.1 amidase [Planctomycetota bacterium]